MENVQVPKKLLLDIYEYLDKWQGVTDEQTEKHNRFIYAIDLVLPDLRLSHNSSYETTQSKIASFKSAKADFS